MDKKILFYTSVSRIFKSTLIGHLFELCQRSPVVLLSEELDQETKDLLNNKKYFPKLEGVVSVNQYSKLGGSKIKNLLIKNKRLVVLSKKIINDYKPEIIVVEDDLSLFEMYLIREGKKQGVKVVCAQGGIRFNPKKQLKWVVLMAAFERYPKFIPVGISIVIEMIKRYVGHFLYYWCLPMLAGEHPFPGKSSEVLWNWISGFRGADFCVVFSDRNKKVYLEAGVRRAKVLVLSHPLSRGVNPFLHNEKEPVLDKKTLLLLFPIKTPGIRKKDLSFISADDIRKKQIETIKKISNLMGDWKILIKPHPSTEDMKEVEEMLNGVKGIKLIDKKDTVEKYIGSSEVIVSFSPSTALYTASLQHPEKPIIYLDIQNNLIGELCRELDNIEYINSEKDFEKRIINIKNGKIMDKPEKDKPMKTDFNNFNEIIDYVKITN